MKHTHYTHSMAFYHEGQTVDCHPYVHIPDEPHADRVARVVEEMGVRAKFDRVEMAKYKTPINIEKFQAPLKVLKEKQNARNRKA